ncbi:MAG TPA: phosphate ABC transporter permease subunit PstC [Microthrixaceae bacterium]|nr:phosphate ABC transporter permease subunit PstC [Microthrixaceae bacterium]
MTVAPLDTTTLTRRRRGPSVDRAFAWLTLGGGLVILVVLAGIAISTTQKAWPAFREEGLGFLLSDNWNPNEGEFGALAFVYGTAIVSLIALVISVPMSVGIALFVNEVAPRRIKAFTITVMDLMAAVPSVVYGLVGFAVLRPEVKGLFNSIADAVSGIPVLSTIFGESQSGMSFMLAGLILVLMVTPIITSISREVFATVPEGDKAGALALGATRYEMIRGVVVPHSFGGVVGAVMLGLGRAMGETIAVVLVIGASPQIVANLFAPGEAMPSVIARNLNESSGTYQAALIGLGVALFGLTIVVNMSARGIVSRLERRMRGAA